MTRQPDIKNKNDRLTYVPVDLSEKKLAQDAKALCVQDGITIRDFLSECIELGFKVHHWPPGNPQLTLPRFQESLVEQPKCACGKPAVKFAVHLASKKESGFCAKCFSGVPQRYDGKVWRVSDSVTAKCIGGSKE